MTARVVDTELARELYRVVYRPGLAEVIAARRLGKPLEVVLPEGDFVDAFCSAPRTADDKNATADYIAEFIDRRLDEAHPGYPYMTRWSD